jgi:hypothetical protein
MEIETLSTGYSSFGIGADRSTLQSVIFIEKMTPFNAPKKSSLIPKLL